MAKRQQFLAIIGFLLAAKSDLVNSRDWYNSQRSSPSQSYPQQSQRQSSIDIVRGTIDQLNRIDAKWVCTNPKTGDQEVVSAPVASNASLTYRQMIIGTEIENGNTANNNAYVPQYTATSNTVPWGVQQPNNLQEQISTYNPSPTWYPKTPGVGNNEAPLSPTPLTVEQERKKFANWDWTQYVTMEPTNNVAYDGMRTVAHEPARMISSTSPNTIGYDGQGVIEPRTFPIHE